MSATQAKSKHVEVQTTPGMKTLLQGVLTSSSKNAAEFLPKECGRVQ